VSRRLLLSSGAVYGRRGIGFAVWLHLARLRVRIFGLRAGATTRKAPFARLHHNLPNFFERAARLSRREKGFVHPRFFRIVAWQAILAGAAAGVTVAQSGSAVPRPSTEVSDRSAYAITPQSSTCLPGGSTDSTGMLHQGNSVGCQSADRNGPLIVPRNWAPPDIDQSVPPVRSDASCPLEGMLAGASKRALHLVANLQKFSATDHIEHIEFGKDGKPRISRSQNADYVAQIDQGDSVPLQIEEYRLSSTNLSPPFTDTGTAAFALIFHPQQIANFEFQCEGLTDLHGVRAWQVHFEETADPNEAFHVIRIGGSSYKLRFKGRAWIGAENQEVLRMETDLVTPIPKIDLQVEHMEIAYAPVEFKKRNLQLWLPESAALYIGYRGHRYERMHNFSHFQLFWIDTQQTVKDAAGVTAAQSGNAVPGAEVSDRAAYAITPKSPTRMSGGSTDSTGMLHERNSVGFESADRSGPLVVPRNWAPPDIDQSVPPVRGDASCPLEGMLAGASKRALDLVENLQKFSATDHIEHIEFGKDGKPRISRSQNANYVAQIDQGDSGPLQIEEYRHSSIDLATPFTDTGTAAFALIFHPRQIASFEFQCEGLTDLHGVLAWQVHFEETADPNEAFHVIRIRGSSYKLRIKGRAWIGDENQQVLRMETDLVTPNPKINLQVEHMEIAYAPVEFKKRNLQLWLPESAALYIGYRGHRYERVHNFSHFQLFWIDTQQTVKDPTAGSGNDEP
jgi:hypothetical protein